MLKGQRSRQFNLQQNHLLWWATSGLGQAKCESCLPKRTSWNSSSFWALIYRPLALRGHVTNASLKQWVGILLMPKIDREHKNYLTPEIWEETHLGRYFMALWFCHKVVGFVYAAILEGILLPSNMAANTFCLWLVKYLLVMLKCAVNVTTSSFQHFLWRLSAKFVFRKR